MVTPRRERRPSSASRSRLRREHELSLQLQFYKMPKNLARILVSLNHLKTFLYLPKENLSFVSITSPVGLERPQPQGETAPKRQPKPPTAPSPSLCATVGTSAEEKMEVRRHPPTTRARRGKWYCCSTSAAHRLRAVSIVGPAAKVMVWGEKASVVIFPVSF